MTQKAIDFPFGTLVNLIILGLFVWLILPARWIDPVIYDTEYQITKNQVHWHYKPTDCDFMSTPLGDKRCHYKKLVTAYNAVGDAVGGDNAPTYNKNSEGENIVSYDKGKTWKLLDTVRPDPTVVKVEIYWVRVMD